MNLRHFLLRLHLTRGIGLRGEYLVAQWLADHPGQLKQLLPQQIVKIAGILPRFQRLFEQDFISMRVSTAVERHLNSTQFMTIFDDEYPLLLHESWLPPVVLFYQGNINLLRSSSFFWESWGPDVRARMRNKQLSSFYQQSFNVLWSLFLV